MAEINLIHGDSLAAMRGMRDKQYSLAVVDPPYGIDAGNLDFSRSKQRTNFGATKYASKGWDSSVPSQEYFEQLFRVSQNQIIWGGNNFSHLPCSKCWIV